MEIPCKLNKKKEELELAFNRVVAIGKKVEQISRENIITSKRTKSFSLDDPIRDIFNWALKELRYGDLYLCPDESSKEEKAITF